MENQVKNSSPKRLERLLDSSLNNSKVYEDVEESLIIELQDPYLDNSRILRDRKERAGKERYQDLFSKRKQNTQIGLQKSSPRTHRPTPDVNYIESASDTSSVRSVSTPRSPSKDETTKNTTKSSGVLALKVTAILKKNISERSSPVVHAQRSSDSSKKNNGSVSQGPIPALQKKAHRVSPASVVIEV